MVDAQTSAASMGEEQEKQAQAEEGQEQRDFTQETGDGDGDDEGEEDAGEGEGEGDDEYLDDDGEDEGDDGVSVESAENDLQEEVMTGDGVGWWKGGNVITGLSSGWFNSAGGTMGEAAKAERVDYRNEGTRNPISSDDLVELAKVPSPLYHLSTT